MKPVTIAVVTAGLSQPSSTRLLADRLASATVRRVAEAGGQAEVTVTELRDLAHDITDALLTGFAGPAVAEVIGLVTGADALIAVTPLFSGSYSGLFKSFFDVLEPGAIDGLPVLIGATGGTPRHSLALEYAIRPLMTYLRARTVPTAVFAATSDWGDRAGGQALGARIDRAADELAALVAVPVPADGKGPSSGSQAGQDQPAGPARRSGDPFASFTPFEDLLRGA
jgi:FMN reductase